VLSPDATRVVYTVRTTDWTRTAATRSCGCWTCAHRRPRRACSRAAASATDPEWSPNGDAIYFLSGRSGSSQVWRCR
jgi:hypothetical protein